MRTRWLWVVLAAAVLVANGAGLAAAAGATSETLRRASASSTHAQLGPYAVKIELEEWRDGARQRTLPIRITYPEGLKQPQPVVLFSHGLGGTRDAGALWAEHWASHGYIVVHLQHPGSDAGLLKGGKQGPLQNLRSGMSPKELLARAADVRFVLDELARRKKQGGGTAWLANADLSRVGMSGHSFGAQTTQAVAGQTFLVALGQQSPLADTRVRAAIAFSPNARSGLRDLDRQFGSIRMPFLSLTGTKDVVPMLSDQPASDRLLVFKHMPPGGKLLANFEGGDHMVFGGHEMRRAPTQVDRAIQTDVKALTLAFWDAWLRDKPEARSWLTDGSAARSLTAKAEYSTK